MIRDPFVYILKLEGDNYYIGTTINPLFRIASHFFNPKTAWAKLFNPVDVVAILPGERDIEDAVTLAAMDFYGEDAVRGGSFWKPYYQYAIKKLRARDLHFRY